MIGLIAIVDKVVLSVLVKSGTRPQLTTQQVRQRVNDMGAIFASEIALPSRPLG